jgi:hypothetical protein
MWNSSKRSSLDSIEEKIWRGFQQGMEILEAERAGRGAGAEQTVPMHPGCADGLKFERVVSKRRL